MNIRDLKYLVAVASQGHFGKAAETCFVSQPALSMQVKKLEAELGVLVFERSNKGFYITEVGKLIIAQAREILYRLENMLEIANLAKDPLSGELYIGIIPSLAPYLLPLIVPGLSAHFPKLTFFLIEDTTDNLLNRLAKGELDTALLALPTEGDFKAEYLFDEAFLLAVPLSHPLANQKEVDYSDLETKSLLLLEDGHCLRDQALSICFQAKAEESKSFRATSMETLRHMVAAGVGITLMPELACRTNDNVCYLPFKKEKPQRTIGMIWRESTVKEVILQEMVHYIKNKQNRRFSQDPAQNEP